MSNDLIVNIILVILAILLIVSYMVYVIIDERKKWTMREFFKYRIYYEVDYFLYMDMVKKMKKVLFKKKFELVCLSVLIFALRKKDNTPFDWEAFERTVKLMHDQTDANLDMLTKMNKQKDKIEEKIKAKKKILGLKLVD